MKQISKQTSTLFNGWQKIRCDGGKSNLFRIDYYLKPVLVILAFAMISPSFFAQEKKFWLTAGQSLQNTRSAAAETKISTKTANTLGVKWSFTTDGDVSANPAVDMKQRNQF
ncbi:MAG: hypothetical protein ABIS01_07460 [Ferruginibacter sp.]